jgi:hypothetical protein
LWPTALLLLLSEMRDEILACGSISEEFDGESMSICKQNVVQFCKFCDFDKKFGPDRPSRLATCLWYFYTAPGRTRGVRTSLSILSTENSQANFEFSEQEKCLNPRQNHKNLMKKTVLGP